MIIRILFFSVGIITGAFLVIGYHCSRAENADAIPVRIVNNSGKACDVLGKVTTSGKEPFRKRVDAGETATLFPWHEPVSVVQSLLVLEVEQESNRTVFELSPEELASISDSTTPLTIELGPNLTLISSGEIINRSGIQE